MSFSASNISNPLDTNQRSPSGGFLWESFFSVYDLKKTQYADVLLYNTKFVEVFVSKNKKRGRGGESSVNVKGRRQQTTAGSLSEMKFAMATTQSPD